MKKTSTGKKLQIFQIDSFTKELFSGNPAAVCPLNEWLDEKLMQKIANENNLSETTFFVKNGNHFDIRWFSPIKKVNLCGHATLAAAYVIFSELGYKENFIHFNSKKGKLSVTLNDDLSLTMDFPSSPPKEFPMPEIASEAFGILPISFYIGGEDGVFLFNNEEDIATIKPNLTLLKTMNIRGIAITSTSKNYDFISRFFSSKYGINEDHVTGSAHCILAPFWAKKLNKPFLKAKQVSKRGGEIRCQVENNRVFLSGYAKKYFEGFINL